jgi:hypothetical protein
MQPTTQSLPPEAIVAQMAMAGWISSAISEIARRNIPDMLKARGASSAADLAPELEVNPAALERVLRACASVGLFVEDASGKFGLTPLSEVLTSDSPVSVKAVSREMGGMWLKMMGYLGDSVRTGEPQPQQYCGMDSFWDYLNAHPRDLAAFGEAMQSNSLNSLRGVLAHCDFTGVRKVVDIAGGFGHLAAALLEKYPALRAAVLDLPDLIPIAEKSLTLSEQVASRLQYVGGDMFQSVPAGDCHIMKHIIHDWDDEHCHTLLTNCHQSLEPNGRLICVDAVLPPMGDTSGTAAKFLDLLMMTAIRGKERTLQQWEELYGSTGFRMIRVTKLQDNFGTSIVEGVRV